MTSETTRRRGSAVGLAALLVLIGGAGGVAFDRLVLGARTSDPGDHRRRGPPDAEQILERYRERLELDAIRRAGDDRVRALLRPEQRPKLDQLRADFDSRRAEMRKRLKGEKPPPP